MVVRRSARNDPLALDEEDILVTFGLVGRVTLDARWWHFKSMRRGVDLDLLDLLIYIQFLIYFGWSCGRGETRSRRSSANTTSSELGLVQPSSVPVPDLT